MQTKQSHKHQAPQSCRGSPTSPRRSPEKTLCREQHCHARSHTHTQMHNRNSRAMSRRGSPARSRGPARVAPPSRPPPGAGGNSVTSPRRRWSQPLAQRGRGRGGGPSRVPCAHPLPTVKDPQLHPHLPRRRLHDAEGTSILLRRRRWRGREKEGREERAAPRAGVSGKQRLRTSTRPGGSKAGGRQEDPGRGQSVKRKRRSAGKAWAPAARGVCEARRRGPRGGGGPGAGAQGLPAREQLATSGRVVRFPAAEAPRPPPAPRLLGRGPPAATQAARPSLGPTPPPGRGRWKAAPRSPLRFFHSGRGNFRPQRATQRPTPAAEGTAQAGAGF